MSRYRSQGLIAVGLGLTAAACGDPDLNTELRSAGPPDVLAVLAQSPLDLGEAAVKCRYVDGKRDEKAPGFVGDPITGGSVVCPEDEAEFTAATVDARVIDDAPWALRVMFDELLDGDKVETLICDEDSGTCEGSLAETQPVTLRCGDTVVPYSGYYVPNGNNVTFPLGPSIYIRPDPAALTFPTGSMCTLTLDPDKITDKDGNSVTTEDQAFTFQIADLALIAVDPAEGDDAILSPDPVTAGAVAFVFNASLDDAEIDPAAFQLTDESGADIPTTIFVDAYNAAGLTDAVYVIPDTDTGIFLPGDYTATMKPTEITEVNGGKLTVTEAEVTHFSVAFGKTGQSTGTDFSPVGAIRISFNNTIDASTLDTTNGGTDLEFFQTNPPTTPPNAPVAATIAVGNTTAPALNNIANNAIVITPAMELPIGTYVVRIKAGAEIKDVAATPHIAHFNNPLAITYNVLLKSTHTVPAMPVMGAASLPAVGTFDVVFSGSLDMASVSVDDFELLDTTTMMPVPFTFTLATSVSRPPPSAPSHPNDTIRIDPTANLTVGRTYQLTLKQGAALKSANGVTRTFGAPSTAAANRTTWTFTAI
jgi:hypothetical protein